MDSTHVRRSVHGDENEQNQRDPEADPGAERQERDVVVAETKIHVQLIVIIRVHFLTKFWLGIRPLCAPWFAACKVDQLFPLKSWGASHAWVFFFFLR